MVASAEQTESLKSENKNNRLVMLFFHDRRRMYRVDPFLFSLTLQGDWGTNNKRN